MNARLAIALTQRETGRGWVFTMVIGVVAAAWIAHLAPQLRLAEGPDLMGRALRRFDLALLGSSALLVALRVSQRVASDTASGWLEPYMAAEGRRWRYGVALAASVAATTWLAWLIAAATFALGVRLSDGSAELLRLLPALSAGGLLLLTGFAFYAAVFALITREAVSAMLLAGAAFVAPYLAIAAAAQQNEVPRLLGWLTLYTPGPLPADAPIGAVIQLLHACAAAALVAALSHRVAGRRS